MDHLIRVEDYYKPELMIHMPQEMFDLLDEAIEYGKGLVKISREFVREYQIGYFTNLQNPSYTTIQYYNTQD